MKKLTVLITIVLLAVLSGWLLKDRLSYHYNVWRMTHAVEEKEIIEYNDRIQALQDKIVNSCFVDTYNDTTMPNRVRRAAAMALIKSDVRLAEILFKQHLDSANPEVSGMAIRDLGTIKSIRYKNRIVLYKNSTNEIVRWSVIDYLGHFSDAESIETLKELQINDKSEMIRTAATDRLKQLLKQTGS